MKAGVYRERPLTGKTLGMIFAKSSTRTRVSFEVGALQLGGHALFLSSRDIQLGRGEPIRDMARVLSRMVDGIMIRTFAHADVEELARYATVPVINGLTDLLHPCQVLADLLTRWRRSARSTGKTVAWIGDGNNMCNSWLNAAAVLGFEIRLACPEGYEPDHDHLRAERGKDPRDDRLADPDEAVEGAHVVTTDVWASMGQEGEAVLRAQAFQGYMRGPGPDAARRPRGDLPPLPAGAPGRGSGRGGARRPAIAGVGRGGEPPACPEGPDGDADGIGSTSCCIPPA